MSKQKYQQITMDELVFGDRFYFKSDKKKIPYQFVKRNWKTVSYISAAIADRGHPFESLLKWANESSYNRQIVYLRNVNEPCA